MPSLKGQPLADAINRLMKKVKRICNMQNYIFISDHHQIVMCSLLYVLYVCILISCMVNNRSVCFLVLRIFKWNCIFYCLRRTYWVCIRTLKHRNLSTSSSLLLLKGIQSIFFHIHHIHVHYFSNSKVLVEWQRRVSVNVWFQCICTSFERHFRGTCSQF